MGCSVSINVAEPPPKESGTSGASGTSEAPVVVAAVVPDEGGGVAAGKVTEATPVAVVLPSAVVESHGIVPEWTKVASSLTWAASQKFVSDKKGRLVTLEEARSFLKNRGSSLYPGEDQWLLVFGKMAQRTGFRSVTSCIMWENHMSMSNPDIPNGVMMLLAIHPMLDL